MSDSLLPVSPLCSETSKAAFTELWPDGRSPGLSAAVPSSSLDLALDLAFSFVASKSRLTKHPSTSFTNNNDFVVNSNAASSMATTVARPSGEQNDPIPVDTSATEVEKAPVVDPNVVDPNVVDWDGPDDPANPMNFSGSVKTINVGIVSALTFITPLASSMFAPGVPELMAEFHSTNRLLAGFVVSVYVLGFAIGPLILAPASELYGRRIIYHICNVGFIVFSVACAVSTDLGMLVAFRFFQGCFGSAPVTNGMFNAHLCN